MKTKVLFVDDQPNVLAGLRRMLRGQRKVWDMYFANDGKEALELFKQESIDVIVSDMRMPGMDGAELLTRVSQEYPNTVRLVLSGQSEHEKIFRSIGPAHQFLSKPCDPDLLINTIVGACGLHSQLQEEALIELISQLTSLPSLPRLYRELMDELESDNASIERVGNRIGSDVAMTAKVLQLVNSSFFGLPQKVSSAKHAVSLLGLNIIRPLVLTASVFSQYGEPEIENFSLEELTHHSLSVATTARRIAESETQNNQIIDDAFIAGMVHDIGKLVLAVNLPEKHSESVMLATTKSLPDWKAEKEVFGATHADVGAHLLGLWGLPDTIVEAVAFHHNPSASNNSTFSALTAVHAANVLQHPFQHDGDARSSPDWDCSYIDSIRATTRTSDWISLANLSETTA